MSINFENDLKKLYKIVGKRQKELGELYDVLETGENFDKALQNSFEELFLELELPVTAQNKLALISRLVSLRDEQLVQVLSSEGNSAKEIEKKKRIAYFWVRNFYLKRHEELLKVIESEELLTPFYRRLLQGVHEVGVVLSSWQDDWNEHIINTINPKLKELYGENVMSFLQTNELLEKDESGDVADRAYSVLEYRDNTFTPQPYAIFFAEDVKNVVSALEKLIKDLSSMADEETNQKDEYIEYFKALSLAFKEKDSSLLIKRWADVDRAWMQVKSPIQVGHPLEYYEDHYRKAVALEWDIRLSNPQSLGADTTYDNILSMYKAIFNQVGKEFADVYELTLSNLQRVQLYIGRPAFYYGAEFNGLFSAQVVPNDEIVSKEEGKKIFAFSDNILDSIKAKPFLKIQREVFGEQFLNKERELVFKKPDIWHKVYEVTTIGHEYGHILWLDEDSESIMNKSGVFKNIEEFKATMGGLMAFFTNEDDEIKEYVLSDTIKRAVGLIAWKETSEVEPYYCEGLIHLQGLFESGVLAFDGKLHIDISKYDVLKKWYTKTYESLATHYLAKKDAKEFLANFVQKEVDSYMPIDKKVQSFVKYYWNLHISIGRDIDELSSKSDWI